MVFLKQFFEKVDFEKNQQTTKKHKILPSRQRANGVCFIHNGDKNIQAITPCPHSNYGDTHGYWDSDEPRMVNNVFAFHYDGYLKNI